MFSNVQVAFFDVFGTVVNWEASVTRQLSEFTFQHGLNIDCSDFTRQWRAGYYRQTKAIAAGKPGPTNVDLMHRELLDELLLRPEYSALDAVCSEKERQDLVQFWHKLTPWSDSVRGINQLRKDKHVLAGTLSNGSIRLLVDVARYADLTWDFVFSGELFKSYKPDPEVYLGACRLLGVEASQVVMVAAHIYDLQAAAAVGFKTIYVYRETEDVGFSEGGRNVKSKIDGGKVDAVVQGIDEIARLFT